MAKAPFDADLFDRLRAEGVDERVARAKAKAAAMRRTRTPSAPSVAASSTATITAPVATAAASMDAAPVPSADRRLTYAERTARVAASLGKGGAQASMGVPAASARTHRMLALVPPAGIQQVRTEQDDKVYTWPHLLLVEFVSLLAVGALVLVASFFLDAPLGSLANANEELP